MSTTTTSTSSGPHILSSKVARALQVQTSTPSMTSALSALDNLPSASHGIDARGVRAAIEKDALQQALLFEEELRKLVAVVSDLKKNVGGISEAARKVSRAVETDVVCTAVWEGEGGGTNKDNSDDENKDNSPNTSGNDGNQQGHTYRLEEERNLARILADAFRNRDEAARRAETVRTFLEKFDLSENDNYLLDHYAFEEFLDPKHHHQGGEGGEAGGMSFLNALRRVCKIRIELAKTFGASSAEWGLSSSQTTPTADEGGRLGATSAIRMMENLAAKQERAYERLYHFLQSYLSLTVAAVAHIPTSSAMARQGTHTRLEQHMQQRRIDEDEMDERLSHPFVKRCLAVLKNVPHYHGHTLELIATQRRSEVTRRFLMALTQGSQGRHPIEMKAHDPVNYVGDILAFLFRSLSMECEIARGLIDDDGGFDDAMDDFMLPQDDLTVAMAQKPMTSIEMLSSAMSGVTRPLKSRVLQVLSSLSRRPDDDDEGDGETRDDSVGTDLPLEASMVTPPRSSPDLADIDEEAAASRSRIASIYAIAGLLFFYDTAMEKATWKLAAPTTKRSSSSDITNPTQQQQQEPSEYERDNAKRQSQIALVSALKDCQKEARLSYGTSLRVYAAMLESYAGAMDESEATLAARLVVRLSEERSTSPGFAEQQQGLNVDESGAAEPTWSLTHLCDTMLEAAMTYVTTLDDVAVLKNAIATSQKCGLDSQCDAKWNGILERKEKSMIDELVEMETARTLHQCGLGRVYESLLQVDNLVTDNLPLASQPGLSQEDVTSAMTAFYASLFNPPLPHFDTIKDSDLKLKSRKTTARNVADVYEKLYGKVMEEKAGYDEGLELKHTPEQVRTLLAL